MSMTARFATRLGVACTALLALSGFTLMGCGGGGSSDTSDITSLTSDTTRATETGTEQTATATAALEPLMYATESEQDGRSRQEAAYPIVTVERGGGQTTVTVDYGTTPITTTGGRTVSGTFAINFNKTDRVGTVTYNNFTVNGHSVTGTATLSNLSVSKESFSATVAEDLTFSNYGHVTGTFSLAVTRGTGVLTIPTGSLSVTPHSSTTTYSLGLDSLVMDYKTNGNFIPQSGKTTIQYVTTVVNLPITTNLVVTFNSESPVNGKVDVSVNGASSLPYTLPRFQ